MCKSFTIKSFWEPWDLKRTPISKTELGTIWCVNSVLSFERYQRCICSEWLKRKQFPNATQAKLSTLLVTSTKLPYHILCRKRWSCCGILQHSSNGFQLHTYRYQWISLSLSFLLYSLPIIFLYTFVCAPEQQSVGTKRLTIIAVVMAHDCTRTLCTFWSKRMWRLDVFFPAAFNGKVASQ